MRKVAVAQCPASFRLDRGGWLDQASFDHPFITILSGMHSKPTWANILPPVQAERETSNIVSIGSMASIVLHFARVAHSGARKTHDIRNRCVIGVAKRRVHAEIGIVFLLAAEESLAIGSSRGFGG